MKTFKRNLCGSQMQNGIIHSELYLSTHNSYFTATDYIVLQAVSILF